MLNQCSLDESAKESDWDKVLEFRNFWVVGSSMRPNDSFAFLLHGLGQCLRSGCHSEISQTRGFNNRNCFLRRPPSHWVPTQPLLCVCMNSRDLFLCPPVLTRPLALMGGGPTVMTSLNHNYLLKTLYANTVTWWGWGQGFTLWILGTQVSP